MASAVDSSSKHWWSMAKSSAGHTSDLPPEKPKSKAKALNSFFGLKSKKQAPSLSIQDPPLPIQPIPLEDEPLYPNRPPSKSVSSTRSRPDSLEPRTPSDLQHHHSIARQSLLTLSDTDPFALKRSISIISPPPLPSDPTRLSAYSNASSSEQGQRKHTDNTPLQRSSYASSSYSQNQGNESPLPLSPASPVLPPASIAFTSKLLTKRSDPALNGKKGHQPSPLLAHPGTSATTGPNVSSRPPMRPRGLTDNGIAQSSGFFVDRLNNSTPASSSKPPESRSAQSSRAPSSRRPSNASSTRAPPLASPRVVIRQASLQTITNPAPPPTQRLPPPPPPQRNPYEQSDRQPRRLHSDSNASSTISFANLTIESAFPGPPLSAPPVRTRRVSDRNVFPGSTPLTEKSSPPERAESTLSPRSASKTLKKALSHQSLLKRGPLFSTPSTPQKLAEQPLQDQDKEKESVDKEKLSKLRIFPQARMPPVPSKPANASATTLSDATPQDQKRSSTTSTRKRLFSGSSLRRPSTSHSTTVKDEDALSVFSMKSEQDLYINTSFFKPWITAQPSHPSFWDEAPPEAVPASPIRASGEPPVSPTLGRLELTREAPSISFSSPTLTASSRQRGFSVRSSNTVTSTEGDGDSIQSGLSPRSYTSGHSRFHRANTINSPRGSIPNQNRRDASSTPTSIGRPRTATNSSIPERKPSVRPATAQPALASGPDSSSSGSLFRSSSPPPEMVSLPPPPRRTRNRPVISEPEEQKSPPKPATIVLAPPPARVPRPKMSFEKTIHRRSIMKKPSFLEISDDDDDLQDEKKVVVGGSFLEENEDMVQLFDDLPVPRKPVERGARNSAASRNTTPSTKSPLPTRSESFLDFARESFDTTRSD